MSLQVRVFGPGVDERRRLEPGAPALIVGRDSDCAIWLPDPQRNVSRRHLSLWNEGGLLQFHVLSLVNGVHTPAGELPPGARGALAPGEELAVSVFRIAVSLADVPAAAPPFLDTWAQLQHEAERLPHPDDPTAPAPVAAPAAPAPAAEEDPFGDWGFHSTFGPGTPGGSRQADALAAAMDLQAFLAALGLDAPSAASLTRGELEMIGRVTRIALQALLQASEAAGDTQREPRAAGAMTTRQDPIRGVLADFEPQALEPPVQELLERHFARAYARALMRAKRNTAGPPDG